MIFDVRQSGFFQAIYYNFHKHIMRRLIEYSASYVFGVTSETCDYLKKVEGFSVDKVKHLPLAIDENHFRVLKQYKLNQSKQKVQILQTGKLNEAKKPQWLAEACIRLLEMGYPIELSFVGSGDQVLLKNIKEKFRKRDLQDSLEISPLVNFQVPVIFNQLTSWFTQMEHL